MIEESKIRERAHKLWEKDACPEGSEKFYWRLAQDQLEAEIQPSGANSAPISGGANGVAVDFRQQAPELSVNFKG